MGQVLSLQNCGIEVCFSPMASVKLNINRIVPFTWASGEFQAKCAAQFKCIEIYCILPFVFFSNYFFLPYLIYFFYIFVYIFET